MENYNQNGKEDLINWSDLKPLLEMEAVNRKLNIYLFTNDDVRKHYETIDEDISVVLLAKDEDNAWYNLKNFRRCYLININK